MRRAALAWLVLTVAASVCSADRLTLKDGRTFDGAVTEADGKVLIELTYGTISFPSSDVASIEKMASPLDQLAERLAKISRTDADAVYQVAVWAKENALPKKADELLREALVLNPDHAAARKSLGQVKVDGKWLDLADALQVAQGKLEAGKYDALLGGLLAGLEDACGDDAAKLKVKGIEAYARLYSGQFAPARKCFEALAEKAAGADAVRYAAIADLLKAHADGMYVLNEDFPAVAALTGGAGPVLSAGPASLARPAVLSAALHERAKAAVLAGKPLMDEGKRLENVEPEAANAKYALAEKSFSTADALVADISRSWRVEIARRRIAMISKDMNTEAGKFDLMKEELGTRDLTPVAYGNLVNRMLRSLTNVRSDLDAILQLAAPFERDLVLEVTDAKLRLQRINGLRDVLQQELHGK